MPTFETTVRPAMTNFPVPVIQPTGVENSVVAVDISPKGLPEPFGVHGYAWQDISDRSILDMDRGIIPVAGFNCARIGINLTAVWVGSVAYNSAVPKPVEIVVGAVPKIRVTETGTKVVETTTIGTDTTTPGVNNTDQGISLAKQGTIYASRSGYPTSILNRNDAGQISQLRCAGSPVGSMSVDANGVSLSGFKQIDDLLRRVSALETAVANL